MIDPETVNKITKDALKIIYEAIAEAKEF